MRLESGDRVRLKSGGPMMTVQYVNSDHQLDVTCSWFVGDKHFSEAFTMASLEKVESEPESKSPFGKASR